MITPWPFAQWVIDLLGPFPLATGQRKFVVLAIDHFTKWVKASAIATITSANIIKFLRTNILERFGIPHSFLTDNGRQFDCAEFDDFSADWGIKRKFTSVAHPQTNSLTEVTNRTVLEGIKARLYSHGKS
ncbi:hypothetical protein M5689_020786 [Euphorbia peplus]|nr:hypothetical protein M5689_020786 [Euphorbia peplus]